MPSHQSPAKNNPNRTKSSKGNLRRNQYICRLCRQQHALRKCERFLDMNTTKRREIVQTYGYCQNCLAHSHSQGNCFTKTGCKYCHHQHHSLLHIHPILEEGIRTRQSPVGSNRIYSRNQSQRHDSPSRDLNTRKRTSLATSDTITASLTAILKGNTATLLPTVVVQIDSPKGKQNLRCLLDSGARYSSISSKTVSKLGLTTLTLKDETICPLTLHSVYDTDIMIESTLRMTTE